MSAGRREFVAVPVIVPVARQQFCIVERLEPLGQRARRHRRERALDIRKARTSRMYGEQRGRGRGGHPRRRQQ